MKIIRCDDAGENKVLARESDKNELGNFLIYSPRETTAEWSGGKSICNSHGKSQSNDESCGIQWLRDNNCGLRRHRLPHYWIIYCTRHAKYAKHLRVFGEMCVVADTDSKVERTKIDPRVKNDYLLGTVPNMQEMSTDS